MLSKFFLLQKSSFRASSLFTRMPHFYFSQAGKPPGNKPGPIFTSPSANPI
jgi:hypothetical protein